MKITAAELRRIIKEEVEKVVAEAHGSSMLDKVKGLSKNEFGEYLRDGNPLTMREQDALLTPASLAMMARAVIKAMDEGNADEFVANVASKRAAIPGVIPNTAVLHIADVASELSSMSPAEQQALVSKLDQMDAALSRSKSKRSRFGYDPDLEGERAAASVAAARARRMGPWRQ